MNRRTLLILTGLTAVIIGFVGYFAVFNKMTGGENKYSRLEYSQSQSIPAGSNMFPGEFDKQQAVWLQWPSEIYNTGDYPVNPVMVKIIKALDPYIRVNVMARNTDEIVRVRSLLKTSGYTGTNAHFYVVNHMSIWARDVGPIFIKDSRYMTKVADFGFNNYSRDGNPEYINTEKQVDRLSAKVLGLPAVPSSLISEGGAIESNGRGVMMTTESVVLKRNPSMTRQQIENEYKRVLGVSKIIWLKKGLAEDDRITGGHINEFARFASPNTILLAQVLPQDRYTNSYTQETYLRMEENYTILKNATDQAGNPFKIIRIPLPAGIYGTADSTGKTPVRSYLNYAVTNGAVLFQTYWKAGRPSALKTTEDQVMETFRSIFKGRTIIGIDAENINRWGGGIHCVTQHMPAY